MRGTVLRAVREEGKEGGEEGRTEQEGGQQKAEVALRNRTRISGLQWPFSCKGYHVSPRVAL